jgi:peroxiredoxin
VLVFPTEDAGDLAAMLSPFDEHLVEFGHRRVQVLAVVDATAREARELADRAPFLGLTLLADEDGSIREAYAPDGGQCFLVDSAGYLRAVVPLGADAVEVLLRQADALGPRSSR